MGDSISPEGQVRIVPDTNILFRGGHHLRAGIWPLVLAAARMGHVRLCVPEIVIRENVAHYKAALVEAQGLIRRGNSALRKAGAQSITRADVGDAEIEARVATYDEWLRSTIKECGEILPIPTVDHSVLVDAVLSARKPFSRGEKGYKDALIWYSTVTAAGDGPLTFVTDDTSDFFDKDGKTLAPELLSDLDGADLSSEDIRPMTDLVLVISEYLPNNPEALEAFKVFAHSPDGMDRLKEVIVGMFETEQRIFEPLTSKRGPKSPGAETHPARPQRVGRLCAGAGASLGSSLRGSARSRHWGQRVRRTYNKKESARTASHGSVGDALGRAGPSRSARVEFALIG